MQHKRIILLGAVVIFVGVMCIYVPRMKTEFLPQSDQGRLQITAELPIGTSQDVTREVAARIYDQITKDVKEIQVMSYRLGQADTDNAFASMQSNGVYLISYNINLGSMENRDRSVFEIADIIRADLELFPELNRFTVTQGMGMGSSASVQLEIYGYDFAETERVAREAREKMLADPSFTQVVLSRDQYTPEYQVDFDRRKLAEAGLTSTAAASAFSAAMSGTTTSYFREAGEEYNIRVRYAPEFRCSVQDIENIIIYNPAGTGIRIRDLGTVVEDKLPPTIERKNRDRLITVTGTIARGHALSDGVTVTQSIMNEMPLPSTISWAIGGDFEDQQDMFSDMILLILLILILVYMVMASQFEAFLGPFVIMFSVPFAFVGVAIASLLHGMALGLIAYTEMPSFWLLTKNVSY